MRVLLIFFIITEYSVAVSAEAPEIINHQDHFASGTGESAVNNYTAQQQKLSGQLGLSFNIGFLMTYDDLLIDEGLNPKNGFGIPLGAGLYCFVSENLAGTIEFTYILIPELLRLWGSHETWSMLEFGASLKYINSPTSNKSVYWKLGLKMAYLRGSQSPGTNLFGGIVGSSLKTKTDFAPGGELAIGLTGNLVKGTTWFAEVTFSHFLMKGTDVRTDGGTAAWSYPHNLTLYRIMIGLLIPI